MKKSPSRKGNCANECVWSESFSKCSMDNCCHCTSNKWVSVYMCATEWVNEWVHVIKWMTLSEWLTDWVNQRMSKWANEWVSGSENEWGIQCFVTLFHIHIENIFNYSRSYLYLAPLIAAAKRPKGRWPFLLHYPNKQTGFPILSAKGGAIWNDFISCVGYSGEAHSR